ncbi:AAA family ATPase [Aquibacillus kalidii]|uniref:AAA family ATPase n=1 Tax=Aquibacillus kalidii TaxID=2762597 RepID=UPI0038B24959
MLHEKELEQQIKNWTSIESLPPLSEVEVLRSIDNYKNESLHISEEVVSVLYSMLAFYRLRRNYNDDDITKILLKQANNSDGNTMSQEIMNLKQFFNFYSTLEQSSLGAWSIRETDFEPAKLKKLNELLEIVETFLETNHYVKENTNNQLSALYNQILEEFYHLQDLVLESIEGLENKRSGTPVKQINDSVRRINTLKEKFHQQFPTIFTNNRQEDPLEKLNVMVGLKEVKTYIQNYYHYLKYQKQRKKLGFQMVDEPGLHMIITGNPGTGKTTIARLLAEIYFELGLLETSNVTEVNRSHLVGSYVGQSEENTINYVKESQGGILFIDEAYSLKREGQSGNDYGQAVIDTLVSSMTSKEYSNRFAVILAGYPEEMRQFLWSNPGLRSRFPEQNSIDLPNFEMDELLKIAEDTALQNDYFFTEEALNRFKGIIDKSRVDETFGNARTVRDLVLKAIFKKGASKHISMKEDWIEHMRIDSSDLDIMDNTSTDEQPMKQLDQLVGLNQVKQEVKKLSSFVRIQQKRKQKGLPGVPVQLHAIFSGNPGTGKTTIAKIYSQILKECGLLKRGHFVLASRSDLVAGFVGQTAMKTKQKVREALGGVLFIDEAYSLYRGEKDFGKEAIDTLVDEMTKHNENLVVILAGYQNEMEQFISSNPGLESRFKKYFHFEDYNQEELISITKFHVNNYQYEMDEEALNFLQEKFSEHSVGGNARSVINLIDEAIQYQALRMVQEEDLESIQSLQKLGRKDFEHAWSTVRGKKS